MVIESREKGEIMSINKAAATVLKKSGSAIVSGSNILWSSGQAWDGLIIEQHILARKNVPELKTSDNSLVVQFSPPQPGKDKIKKSETAAHSANICFFSTGLQPCRPCLHHPHEMLVLILSRAVVDRAARELSVNLHTSLTEHHLISDAQVEYIGMALKTEAESGFLSGRLYGESLGTALSAHLLSKYSALKPDRHKGGLTPANLRRVLAYINDNLAEEIGLGALAKVANLSPFRFAHNFKEATGLAPHQYIIRERLERAKKMLRETNLTVTTIAYATGFGSPSRFTLLFRRDNGVSPSVFRSSYR